MLKRLFLVICLLLPIVLYSQNLDIQILRAINSPEKLPSDDFFRFVSNSDAYIVAGIPLGIGLAGLIKHNKGMVRKACVMIVSTTLSTGITSLLKYTVKRERPFVTYPDIIQKSSAPGPSFPSNHTSSAFSTATSLSLIYPKWYVIAPSYLWASTVGYSRMHLGVHYPSDLLCGAIIGAGSSYFTYRADKWLNSRNKKKKMDDEDI
jgi:membrane-associated phospholipid phosphatase